MKDKTAEKTLKTVVLLFGLPKKPEDDEGFLNAFLKTEGYRIVCGGTSAVRVAKYLKKDLFQSLDYIDKEVPPSAKIEGIDLVTEGLVTMNKVLKLLEEGFKSDEGTKSDGAELIAKALLKAKRIYFFIGRAENEANRTYPAELLGKEELIKRITTFLKDGKTEIISEIK